MSKNILLSDVCDTVTRVSFGSIGITIQNEKITAIKIFPGEFLEKPAVDYLSKEAVKQIQAYLMQPDFRLELPVQMQGTEIFQKIWSYLMSIPSGQTRTYGEIGSILHFSPYVITRACAENPLALYIPSHRAVAIIGNKGLVGEGDPMLPHVQTKYWLLKHEGFLPV